MKRDFRELIPNKENPRKITRKNLDKLVSSILLFPKMLEIRPIITKDDIILSGNMRHKALMEIYTLNDSDLSRLILNSDRDIDPDKIVNYWLEWKENPIVECIETDISENEQKELVIKDNLEYGDYDFPKLKELYTDDELVEFGVMEKEDVPTLEPSRVGAKPRTIEKIRFGKYEVEITMEEYDRLKEKFDSYTEASGTAYGFITSIMNGHS